MVKCTITTARRNTKTRKSTRETSDLMISMDRNPMAGGGMLVKPSADGSRPGYAVSSQEEKQFI